MTTRRQHKTWMKNHPLEGDDIVTGFYNFLIKRNPKTMKPCKDLCVPDTVVFEHNFPRGWYMTDIKAREVMRKQGKELDASTIERGFTEGIPDSCPIVARYLCTQEEELKNGETVTTTLVEVFNKDNIGEFLARKTKRDGILQKFFMPKGYHNSVIQAVWSPRVCLVQRRTNKLCITDKKRAELDPFSTTVTYDGPTHLSEEGSVSGNIAVAIKKICGNVVQHFYYTEHKFITRMVLYFKSDKWDRLWFLWCGSLRVSDRNTPSEKPVNLVTNFSKLEANDYLDEKRLLWDADKAYLRVTNDEMFYETYMKNVKLMTSATPATGPSGRSVTMDEQEAAADCPGVHAEETFDWAVAPSLAQDTYLRLRAEREEVLSVFEDLIYNARNHLLTNRRAYVLTVPPRIVEVLTESSVADLMRLLRLPSVNDGETTGMSYLVENLSIAPLFKLSEDTMRWVNDFFDQKENRLRAAVTVEDDGNDAVGEVNVYEM